MVYLYYISRIPDQNGVSLLYIMLDIHHSGQGPSNILLIVILRDTTNCTLIIIHTRTERGRGRERERGGEGEGERGGRETGRKGEREKEREFVCWLVA